MSWMWQKTQNLNWNESRALFWTWIELKLYETLNRILFRTTLTREHNSFTSYFIPLYKMLTSSLREKVICDDAF